MSGRLRLNAVDMDKVMDEPIDWLWPGVFAKGCISIVSGNPGLGKSTVVASICSIISNGGTWPVTGQTAKRGRAIYVTTEDDVAQDFRPRLYAADAFMERVTFIGDLKWQERATSGPSTYKSTFLNSESFSMKNLIPRL